MSTSVRATATTTSTVRRIARTVRNCGGVVGTAGTAMALVRGFAARGGLPASK